MVLIGVFSCAVVNIAGLVLLAWKWEIDRRVAVPAALLISLASAAIAIVACAILNLAPVRGMALDFIFTGIITILVLAWRFYRDPPRDCPDVTNAILSPADGRVIYVKRIEDKNIPYTEKAGARLNLDEFVQQDMRMSRGFLIGIAMSLIDVHVNRAPVKGRILLVRRIRGFFMSLKREEAVFRNERTLTVIESNGFRVAMIQIASRLVRRIVAFISEGQDIEAGDKIGMIRFGSQVDLIVPDLPGLDMKVAVGQKVKAGLTIVARF